MGRNVITKKALTLEQFTGLVKEKYLELGPAESDKDALNYFWGDEAQNHIKTEYKSSFAGRIRSHLF